MHGFQTNEIYEKKNTTDYRKTCNCVTLNCKCFSTNGTNLNSKTTRTDSGFRNEIMKLVYFKKKNRAINFTIYLVFSILQLTIFNNTLNVIILNIVKKTNRPQLNCLFICVYKLKSHTLMPNIMETT